MADLTFSFRSVRSFIVVLFSLCGFLNVLTPAGAQIPVRAWQVAGP